MGTKRRAGFLWKPKGGGQRKRKLQKNRHGGNQGLLKLRGAVNHCRKPGCGRKGLGKKKMLGSMERREARYILTWQQAVILTKAGCVENIWREGRVGGGGK